MRTPPDTTSADPEQIIADLRRQLAECKAERDEGLQRETAIAEVLRVINASPGNLATVFHAMLEKALRLCEAAFGLLHTYDGERFRALAVGGVSGAAAEALREWVPDPGSALQRIVDGDRVIHIADVVDTEAYRSGVASRLKLVELTGARTALWMALRKDDALLGVFVIYRKEMRPFSDKQIVLLQNFAAQAVIAMENARLLDELRQRTDALEEALGYQTATSDVLKVISRSTFDLHAVLETLVATAARLCAATRGYIATRAEENFRPVATIAPSRGEDAFLRGLSFQPRRGTVTGEALLERRAVHVADIAADPAYASAPAVATPFGERPRSLLGVPLLREGELIGVIVLSRPRVEPFSDRQIELVRTFADQAVIAMENARLINETREALEQQTATAEVLGVINASPGDLAPVFDAMLDKATRLCEASFGILWSFEGEFARAGALCQVPAAYAELCRAPFRPSPGSGPARMMRGEYTLAISDLREYPPYLAGDELTRAIVDLAGARSVVIAPLQKDGVALGAITLYRQEVCPFSDKQTALLQNFAAQAVIAMENARLLTEIREALDQRTATAEVLQVINSSPGNLQPVFNAIASAAAPLCDAANCGVFRFDGSLIHLIAQHGLAGDQLDTLRSTFPLPPGRGSITARAIMTRQVVHVPDLTADVEFAHPSLVEAGLRGGASVPMLREGVAIGAITVTRQESRSFSDKQIALLENFAAQAVIATENARLINETREALEQQTAAAEVLQVINSSPGELAPVFDAMLEKAMRLCEASFGELYSYEDEVFHPLAFAGVPPAYAAFKQERGERHPKPDPGSMAAQVVAGECVVHVVDLKDTDAYRGGDLNRRAMVDLGGARSAVSVALCKDDELRGGVVIYRQEVRPFTDKQIALLQNFAAQAVIAMENARLINETREALEQQTATAEVLGVINSSPGDLAPVFDAMLEKATRLCEAPFGNLRTWDGERFQFGAVYGDPQFSDWIRRRGPWLPSRDDDSPLSRIIRGEQVVRFTVEPGDEDHWNSAGFKEMLEITGMRSGILVALNKDEALLGTISVYRKEVRPFSDKQIGLLQSFAAQAVIAIENARLLGELHQRTEEVAELNRGLEARVAEQVEELGRVGRLKRFLAPQLAELIVSQSNEKILESHRREIVVVFCDLRGYTAFTETAEPEEVLDFLREYHGALGPLVAQFEGTLDQFSGDGIMVFFNDPVPVPDAAARAVNMAVAMREAAGRLIADWRERGRDLGFGVGIAQGYATLGQIGFSERSGYTAIGTVCNVAARLCAEARDGQILLSQRVNAGLRGSVATEQVGALALKGLTQPTVAYNVPLAASQPALRVIEGGPQSL